MIGAEGFELNTGWPYDRLITLDLQKNTAKLAVAIVQSYSEYYFNYSIGDLSTDQSALDLKLFKSILMPIVSKLASILSDELKDRSTREAIVLAHWAAQSYKSEQYTDLWDFCGQLKERFAEGDHVYLVAQDVQNAIDRVVMLSTYSGARFQHSHGVAIYFPWADIVDSKGGRDLSAYRLLKFTQETGWADFLDLYLEATKREPRCVKGEEPKTSHLNVRPGLFGTFAEKALSAKQGKGGGPDDGKGGGPDDGKGGGPDDGKGGGPDDGKGGGPDDGKGAFSDETKGGGPDDGKSGLQLPGLMIGEMKNPPTEWCPTGVPRKTARERSQQKK
jgi:hypothetical protein